MSKKEFFIPLCLLVLLVLGSKAFANSCPDGHEENSRTGDCVVIKGYASQKGKWHPFGGTCEDLGHRKAITLASKIVSSNEPFRLNKGASVCKHNVELIETNSEKILKISTRLGDGIRTNYWNDIKEGNRRRFEFMFDRVIEQNTGFRFGYSIRITQDNTFLRVPDIQNYWYWITQLKSDERNVPPVMVIKVDRFEGISAFDYLIQSSSEFGAIKTDYTPERYGKWVKIAIEYKPSLTNGFRRLWVNDQLVVNENNIQTSYDSMSAKPFHLKFGIYQGIWNCKGKCAFVRNDDQQSIQLKNLYFRRI
jgi:hypothetical protein